MTNHRLLTAMTSSASALAALAIEAENEAARALATANRDEYRKARARIRGCQRMAASMLAPIERAVEALATGADNGTGDDDA